MQYKADSLIAKEVGEGPYHVLTEASGKVLGEPMEIPGIGQYVSITDTEGNRVSILQPLMPSRSK